MDYWQAIILGIVEGLTEFLPVSSTGHLTIAEKLMGLKVDDVGVTAFTAIIQVGAIAAVLLYFRKDIAELAELLHEVLVAQVATYLGVEPSVIDPTIDDD